MSELDLRRIPLPYSNDSETNVMRRVKVGPLMCLILSAALGGRARAQAAGTVVTVKTADAINSASDLAGTVYHGSVTQAVSGGMVIPQGAAAIMTLAHSGSGGWTAQLASLAINGRVVPVSSSSVSVVNAAQSAVTGSLASAAGSALGAVGRKAKVPPSVASAAAGQQVTVSPGTSLRFVLSGPAAPTTAAPTTAAAGTPVAAAGSIATPASAGQTWYQCRSWGMNGDHETIYVTQFFSSDSTSSQISRAYAPYMHATYPALTSFRQLSDFCQVQSNDEAQRAFTLSNQEKQWAAGHWEVIHITYTYRPGQAAAVQAAEAATDAASGAPTAAANQSYAVCTSDRAAPVVYVSDIFTVDALPPSASHGNGGAQRNATNAMNAKFLAFLETKYGYKSGSPVQCSITYSPTPAGLRAAQANKQSAADQARQTKAQLVETGWKNE